MDVDKADTMSGITQKLREWALIGGSEVPFRLTQIQVAFLDSPSAPGFRIDGC